MRYLATDCRKTAVCRFKESRGRLVKLAYTRAEIKNNIRYNEDLINTYQKSVSKLKKQISELKSLKSKMQSYQKDFSNRESKRKSKVINGFGNKKSFRFVSAYINGMKKLITGSEYKKAYNSISSGIKKVDKEISHLRSDVSEYEDKINYRKKRVSYWYDQLKNVKD